MIQLDFKIIMIKQYKLEYIIGSGSYGDVWKAKDQKSKQFVAIKILKFDRAKLEKQFPNYNRQIQIMKKLKHKNIVNLVDQFQYQKQIYIVTQYCENGDLNEYRKKNSLNKQQVLCYFYQLICGIQYMHDQGIMHRDLKPQNIFITNNNIVKIGDFGMGKKKQVPSEQLLHTERVGTPMYSAYEVLISQGNYSDKCDIFSAGLLLWFMIKNDHFFSQAKNIFRLRQLHQNCLNQNSIKKYINSKESDGQYKDILINCLAFEENARLSAKSLKEMLENKFSKYLKKQGISIVKQDEVAKQNSSIKNIDRIQQNLKLFQEMKQRFLWIKKKLKLIEKLNCQKNILNYFKKYSIVFLNLNIGIKQLQKIMNEIRMKKGSYYRDDREIDSLYECLQRYKNKFLRESQNILNWVKKNDDKIKNNEEIKKFIIQFDLKNQKKTQMLKTTYNQFLRKQYQQLYNQFKS